MYVPGQHTLYERSTLCTRPAVACRTSLCSAYMSHALDSAVPIWHTTYMTHAPSMYFIEPVASSAYKATNEPRVGGVPANVPETP
eukprot:1059938-Rhodomonas_salina.2